MKKVLLIVCMVFSLFGCTKGIKYAPKPLPEGTKVTELSFSTGEMSLVSCYTVTFSDEKDHTKIVYDNLASTPVEDTLDAEVMDKLTVLVNEYGVYGWNGFSGSNSMVMDGTRASISLTLSNGETVSCSGENNFVDGFWSFAHELKPYYESYEHDLLESLGYFDYLIIPEPLKMASLYSSYEDELATQENKVTRLKRIYLASEDATRFHELDNRLVEINNEMSEVFDETHGEVLLVTRADENITSLCRYSYEFLDDDYVENITTYNIDTKTGEDLSLFEFFSYTNKENFIRLIRNQLTHDYGESAFFDIEAEYQKWLEDPSLLKFNYGYQGFIFYWNPGEIADTSYDVISVCMDYQYYGLSHVVANHVDNYAYEFILPLTVYADMTNDGVMNRMSFVRLNNPCAPSIIIMHTEENDNYLVEEDLDEQCVYVVNLKGVQITDEFTSRHLFEESEPDDYCNFITGPNLIKKVPTDSKELLNYFREGVE